MTEFADDNCRFDENGRKLSKREENTVGKGEILVTSNFSFSHSVFERLVSQGRQKVSLCGNGLKSLANIAVVVVVMYDINQDQTEQNM